MKVRVYTEIQIGLSSRGKSHVEFVWLAVIVQSSRCFELIPSFFGNSTSLYPSWALSAFIVISFEIISSRSEVSPRSLSSRCRIARRCFRSFHRVAAFRTGDSDSFITLPHCAQVFQVASSLSLCLCGSSFNAVTSPNRMLRQHYFG